ncbi:glycosyltransferase family 2 protein [Nonomuraea dietziae]|uniref:glycosyltransferase family 2 protein n=1 Tax=Nonomuraea dietziae TaxID=65515 RepID=UPI0033D59DAB
MQADVSLIIAVYNKMPYLTECLDSVVSQTIGLDRMQVIAVDDGSTDGGDKELQRFAELYPGSFTVLTQEHSGGPAQPSNRALSMATGRYVFFLGADDHLGPEALERLVSAADTYDSDVVLGRTIGVNGRNLSRAIYERTRPEITLYDSPLPWALSNSKLFRRELVERHGLRFPEHMPVWSDQPFTLEACVRARRISVLADYDYYYAVRRDDASNVGSRTSHLTRLRCTAEVMKSAASLIERGTRRDAVLRRHFTWELSKLLDHDFLTLERERQDDVCAGVGALAEAYLTPAILAQLDRTRRVKLLLAQAGLTDELRELIRRERDGVGSAVVVTGDGVYEALPGFGSLPDHHFALAGSVAGHLRVDDVVRDEDGSLAGRLPLVGASSLRVAFLPVRKGRSQDEDITGCYRLADGHVPPFAEPVSADQHDDHLAIRVHVPYASLTKSRADRAKIFVPRLYVRVANVTYQLPLPQLPGPSTSVVRWRGGKAFRITLGDDSQGNLKIYVNRMSRLKAVRRALRRMRRRKHS